MVLDFMANRNTVMIPICIGNQVVETVMTYKLLRVTTLKRSEMELTCRLYYCLSGKMFVCPKTIKTCRCQPT